MKDFNIAKYLRENHLGSHSILGRYVDLHALNEAPDYNRLRPDELKKLADAGDFTAQRILQKMDDDATQKMKAQDSNPNDDGDCPQGMTPHPVFGCIREREEFNHGQQESDEVPYVGADPKLDGFGDTFDQESPVEEAEELNLSKHYRAGEPRVVNNANAIDRLIKTSIKDKNVARELTGLIILFADAFAEQRIGQLKGDQNWQYK